MKTKLWVSIGIIVGCLALVSLTTSYAYLTASITKENQNNTGLQSGGIGSISYNGQLTFNETEVYPGMKAVQIFTIEKGTQEGPGTYEIDLASVLPDVFGTDIEITLYKTTDEVANNVVREEGELVQTSEGFTKEDQINITGSPEIVYGPTALTNNSQIVLEQTDFETDTLAKTTYYLVYDYKNNENQNSQQGQTFSGTVTVRLIAQTE